MSNAQDNLTRKRSLVGAFADQIRRMPKWHKRLLGLAILLVIVGAGVQLYGLVSDEKSSAPAIDAPDGARTLVASDQASGSREAAWSDRLPKFATRIGMSFVAGFVIGWVFRAFLKTMLLVTILGGGLLLALSYFNVLNLDLTEAQAQYESGKSWIADQGVRLKDAGMRHIPSGVPAVLGAFLGMRRK